MLIYKVLRLHEWQILDREGETEGAPVDRADGYIHFSTAGQLGETLAKHFSGHDNLVLVACEADALGGDLRWEPSRRGALFPHLHRRLRRADMVWSRPLATRDGQPVPPDDLP